MRRPRQDGHTARPLHENATRRSKPQSTQRTRQKPWVSVSSFRYNDKVFRVVVDARTGEVAGDRLYSGWKIFFFVLLIVAVITGIIVLIAMARQKPAPEEEHTIRSRRPHP